MMFGYPGVAVPQVPQMVPQLGLTPGKIPVAPSTTLWMGDIEPYMDENFVYSLYSHTGALTNVKIMRDKTTGQPSGFAFVTFNSVEAATKVLENFNGAPIPGTNRVFRLNFAAHGIGKKAITESRLGIAAAPTPGFPQAAVAAAAQPAPGSSDALFVGDLSPDVTEAYMLQTFQYYFPTAYAARIVTDGATGASKGYGFIHFHDENEKQRALTQMQGYYLSYRPIRLNVATKKEKTVIAGRTPPASAYQPPVQFMGRNPIQLGVMPQPQMQQPQMQQQRPQRPPAYPPGQSGENDPTNVTVFVGGIEPSCTAELLRTCFEKFGEIANVKIPPGKGCGFVEYVSHDSAVNCLKQTGGSAIVGNATVRLGWGRPGSSTPKAPAVNLNPPSTTDASSTNGGAGSEFRNGGQQGGDGSTAGGPVDGEIGTKRGYDASFDLDPQKRQKTDDEEQQPDA